MMDLPLKTSSDDPVVVSNFNEASAIIKNDSFNKRAENLLLKNVMLRDTASMVLLGVYYLDGTPSRKLKSIGLFREAADAGDTSGMRNLAYCYAVGIGVHKDKTAAAILYREAADNGNAAAACNLGVMLDYGNGVEQNYGLAFQYYQIAAAGGNTRGMTNLGEFYNYGKGTAVDLDLAEEWYIMSNSPRAHHRLGVLYLDYPEKRNRTEGLRHLRISADLGYLKAIVRLAKESEGQESIDLYVLAARKGSIEAADRLREMDLPVPETDLVRKRMKKS